MSAVCQTASEHTENILRMIPVTTAQQRVGNAPHKHSWAVSAPCAAHYFVKVIYADSHFLLLIAGCAI
jgi:hypothetical protein